MAPPVKVEYAKSGRSKCTWKKCSQFIEKGELRVGSGSQMPGMDDGSLTYKWRHLCCFSTIQIKNLGSVDHIDGYDECLPQHQEALRRMMKGEFAEQYSSVRGKYLHPNIDSAPAAGASKKKVTGEKRARVGPAVTLAGAYVDTGMESDATDDYEVEVSKGRPQCPFGAACFRKNPDHFAQFAHGTDEDASKGPVSVKVVSYSSATPHQVVPTSTTAAPTSQPTAAPVQTLLVASPGSACPFGPMCLRTDAKHRSEFTH